MEISIKIDQNGTINPIDINDRKWLVSKLKQNKEYKCKITNSRNIKHLGLYWLTMKSLQFHFGNTDIGWHMFFKELFLEPIIFKTRSGEIKKYVNSISFEKMDQIQFDSYFAKIVDLLNQKGYSIEELINTMEV